MASRPEPPRIARFGIFEVDLQARELRKAGLKIRIHDQPFHVLVALMERPGEVVTREELREKIWPGGTFVDFDGGLNTAVNKLREALGDSAVSPRFIETLPRRGYRFLAPINVAGDKGAASASQPVEAPRGIEENSPWNRPKQRLVIRKWWRSHRQVLSNPALRFQHVDDITVELEELKKKSDSGILETGIRPTRNFRGRLLWGAGSIASVAAIMTAVWMLRPETPETQFPVPLTGEAAFETHPSFSPDGNQVAYARGTENGSTYIAIKIIGVAGPPRRLTAKQTCCDVSPAWSPDGRYIAFLRANGPDKNATVLRIPLTGGPEQTLGEIPFPYRRGFGPQLTWLPNGRWVIVDDCRARSEPCGLSAISVDTREKRSLTIPPQGAGDDDGPAVSPDGSWLAFSRGSDFIGQLYLLELSRDFRPKGEPKQITLEHEAHLSPAWAGDGREILFISGRFETASLTRMAIRKGHPGKQQRLAFAGQNVAWPAISHGRRLVYSRFLSASLAIWRVDTSSNNGKATHGVKIIWSTQSDEDPDYSPDGKRIAFTSSRSGSKEIWVCESDGSNPIQLTSLRRPHTASPHWSPDGRTVLFTSTNRDGLEDLFLVNSEGGTPIQLTADRSAPHASRSAGRFSRDGRWIYFDSARRGDSQIWKMPADASRRGGRAVQVTRKGGRRAVESPDGKYLYYVGENYPSPLMKVPVGGGEEAQVLPFVVGGNFAVTEEGIYLIHKSQNGLSIQLLSTSGKMTRIADIGDIGEPGFNLSVSPGPRGVPSSILYVQQESFSANMMLVENFR